MTTLSISSPFPLITDIDGQPLEDGYIWIGTANLPPIGNPIAVYWDAALTIPAALPIRTRGGYPVNAGTPARLYVGSDYSILVQNKNGSTLYSAPDGASDRFSAAQISFLQAGANAVTRTVQSKLRETVSVKDFGAVGDGVADDTLALQHAMAAASGKALYIPAGTYRIDSLILVPANTTVYGDGPGVTVIRVLPNWTASSFNSIFSATGTASNVVIRDMTLDGNKAQASGGYKYLIDASSGASFTNSLFYNLELKECTFTGIYLSSSSHIVIDSCYLHNNGEAAGGNGFGSNIYMSGSSNITVTNCRSEYAYEHGLYLVISNSKIANCTLRFNNTNGISLRGSNNIVEGCLITDNGQDLFRGGGGATILPDVSGPTISNLVFSNNIVRNNAATDREVHFINCDNVVVTNNIIGGPASTAPIGLKFTSNSNNVVVDGNTLTVCPTSIAFTYDSVTYPNCNRVQVTNNQINNNGGSYAIYFDGVGLVGTGIAITGNQFSSAIYAVGFTNAGVTVNDVIVTNNQYIGIGSGAVFDVSGGVNKRFETLTRQIAMAYSATTNAIVSALRVVTETSGTPAVGLGSAIELATEAQANNVEIGARVSCVMTDNTVGSEDFTLLVDVMRNGGLASHTRFEGNGATRSHALQQNQSVVSTSNFFQIAKSILASAAANVLQVTIPAGMYFVGIKATFVNTRAPLTDMETSYVGERYFSIARNGSGSDVVLDSNVGTQDWTGTTTTAGGTYSASSGVAAIARNGAEPNTAPQVVNITFNPECEGSSGTVLLKFELYVVGDMTGFSFV